MAKDAATDEYRGQNAETGAPQVSEVSNLVVAIMQRGAILTRLPERTSRLLPGAFLRRCCVSVW